MLLSGDYTPGDKQNRNFRTRSSEVVVLETHQVIQFSFVRSKFLRAVIALVLLACFACPILEMRDRWDHTLKSGQDTESTFVVVAVCAGAIISFAVRAATLDRPESSEDKEVYASFASVFEPLIISTEFAAVSQPPPALRI